jgi:hypothetical protein
MGTLRCRYSCESRNHTNSQVIDIIYTILLRRFASVLSPDFLTFLPLRLLRLHSVNGLH